MKEEEKKTTTTATTAMSQLMNGCHKKMDTRFYTANNTKSNSYRQLITIVARLRRQTHEVTHTEKHLPHMDTHTHTHTHARLHIQTN